MDNDNIFSDAVTAAGLNPATLPHPVAMKALWAPPPAQEPAPPAPPAKRPNLYVPPGATHKVCRNCRQELPMLAFNKDGGGRRRAICRLCYAQRYRRGAATYRHRFNYTTHKATPRT